MKKLFPILLLALAGCANQNRAPYRGTPGFDSRSDREEDRDFFFRSWYRPEEETAQQKKDYRDFYFGSWFH